MRCCMHVSVWAERRTRGLGKDTRVLPSQPGAPLRPATLASADGVVKKCRWMQMSAPVAGAESPLLLQSPQR